MADETKTEKCNHIQSEERIEFAAGFLYKNPRYINTRCTAGFYRGLNEKYQSEFNITPSQRELYYYVEKARIRIRKVLGPDKEKILQLHKERLTDLLKQCREKGDIKLEFTVLKEIALFEGIYPDKNLLSKNEVVIKDLDPSKLTDRQLDRIIAGEDPAKVLMTPNE